MNPNGTPENLRAPWQKGQPSPNPSGKPRRLPISDTYERLAAELIPDSIRKLLERDGLTLELGATFADALALRVWTSALSGDSGAAKEIREAIEGKTGQRVAPLPATTYLKVIYDDPPPPRRPIDMDATVKPEST